MLNRGEGQESSSPQRVGVILAAVVFAAVVVFVLGVMVGKRGAGKVSVIEEPPASLPMEMPVSASELVSEPPPPAEKPLPSGKLTFFDSLSGDPAAPPPKQSRSRGKKPERSEKRSSAGSGPEGKPTETAPETGGSRPADRINSLLGSGNYYVQISSTTNGAWADDLVAKMKKKGITAKSTSVIIKGKKWYRIRVGTFADRDAAAKASGVFRKTMKIDNMVVSGD